MIRKWSYVAAAMMTLASGMALTSCIDNDEPFGIEQIRLATASLLEAKKSAVNAEQAAKEAEIEIAKINTEIEKLKVENEKIIALAEAKIKEAEAAKIEAEAQAELLKAQGQNAIDQAEAARLLALAAQAEAEADRWAAEAEKVRQETEMSMKERQASLDEQIALAEFNVKTAENTYNEAVYDFEKKKAYNANKATGFLWSKVEYAFGQYLQKINDYNVANKTYLEASRTLAAFELDLVWDKDKKEFVSPNYDQKASLVNAKNELEKDIESYQQTIDTYAEFINKLDEFNQSEWPQLLDEYEQKLDQAEVALKQAELEAQAMYIDQADVFSKPDELNQEFIASRDEVITVPTYTINPLEGPLQALAVVNPLWRDEIEVVGPNAGRNEYNFNGYAMLGGVDGKKAVVDTPYAVRYNTNYRFNYFINKFTLAMYDDNDKAWTNARILELQRQVDNDEALVKAKENWQAAKKAYNDGKKDVVASALPLAAELDEAIAAYKAYEGKLSDQRTKVIAAKKAEAEAQEAYYAALEKWNGSVDEDGKPVYGTSAAQQYSKKLAEIQETEEAAQGKYADACGGWNPVTQTSVDWDKATINAAYEKAQRDAYAKQDQLYGAYLSAQTAYAQDPTQANETAMNNAYLAFQKYAYGYYDAEKEESVPAEIDKIINVASAQYNEARQNAQNELTAAQNKATEDRLAAWNTFTAAGGYNQAIAKDPTYKPVAEAEQKWTEAITAREEEETAASELVSEVTGDVLNDMWNIASQQLNELGCDQLYNYLYNTLPESWQVWDYVNSIDYSYPEPETAPVAVEFPEAYAPVKYMDPTTQVNEVAKQMVIITSHYAYGELGVNYDQDGYATYDYMPDDAFLISDVTIETLNMYINKILLAQNIYGDKQEFDPFTVSSYYRYNFGVFGQQADALTKIEYAKICLNGGDAILAEIESLKTARDEMNSVCEAKAEALTTLLEDYVAAVAAKQELESQATRNVTVAQTNYNAYSSIVDGLKPYVDKAGLAELEDYNENELTSIKALKSEMETQKKTAESKLAGAEIALAKVNEQLAKYEGDNGYASLDNPYTYYVDYLKGNVEIAKLDMEFWSARYQALQAKYDAASKQ